MTKKENQATEQSNSPSQPAEQTSPTVQRTANRPIETTDNKKSRVRSIEYIIVALSGMSPDSAKRLSEKMNEKDRSELRSAYESKDLARGKLQSIVDRLTDEKIAEKAAAN